MKIFHDFDVYDCRYTYDEAKVIFLLGGMPEAEDLDYEDCMRIADAVYWHWLDGRDATEDEKYAMYPWLEFQSQEEDHYIQAYAQRALPEFIKLYKETNI